MHHLTSASKARPAFAVMDPCADKTGIPNLWCQFWAYKGGVVY